MNRRLIRRLLAAITFAVVSVVRAADLTDVRFTMDDQVKLGLPGIAAGSWPGARLNAPPRSS